MKYTKGKTRYTATGKPKSILILGRQSNSFPRIWDPSNDLGTSIPFIFNWLHHGTISKERRRPGRAQYIPVMPTMPNGSSTYQMGLMYWRYFMWNFAGKQNDIQGLGNVRDGNWISGIPFLDNNRSRRSNQNAGKHKGHNKAHNKLYMLAIHSWHHWLRVSIHPQPKRLGR